YSSDSPSCWEMTSRNMRPAGAFSCCRAVAKAALKSPLCNCPTREPAIPKVLDTRPRSAHRRSPMMVRTIIDMTIRGQVTNAPCRIMSSTLRPSINMPSYTWEMKCPVGAESCAQCPAHILRDVGVRYALQLRRFLRLQILEKFLQPADLGLQMSEA